MKATPRSAGQRAAPAGVIRQPISGRALQELFWKRLKVPRAVVQPAIRGAKVAVRPDQWLLRRRLGREIAEALDARHAIPPDLGYRLFGPGELPGARDAARRCAEIASEPARLADREALLHNRRKPFLLSILVGPDFLAHPELVRFMVSRPLLDAATAYLGSVPLLAGANLWWSPANDSARSSQLWHVDKEETSQVKVFVNVTDTGPDQGPFTFLPAPATERLRRALRYDAGRLRDEDVEAAGEGDRALRLVGPAGAGAFVDTSRCLHYGSRGNLRDRLVLLVQFFRFHAAAESNARFQVPPELPGLEPDPIQRLALGLRGGPS
jgi:hypothetical protein